MEFNPGKMQEYLCRRAHSPQVRALAVIMCLQTLHVFVLFISQLFMDRPNAAMMFSMFRLWLSRGLMTGMLWLCFGKGLKLWAVKFMRGAVYMKFFLSAASAFALLLFCIVNSDPSSLGSLFVSDNTAFLISLTILLFLQAQLWRKAEKLLQHVGCWLTNDRSLNIPLNGYVYAGIMTCIAVFNLITVIVFGEDIYARLVSVARGSVMDPGFLWIPGYYLIGPHAIITHILNIAALALYWRIDFVYSRRMYERFIVNVEKTISGPII